MFYNFVSGGQLPWAVIKESDRKKMYAKVFFIKENTDVSTLGPGHPPEFDLYMRYI